MDKKEEFTRVPNLIYDALLKQPLSISQLKTALFIIRKTNGWNKPSDNISYSQIANGAGISRRSAIRAVSDLQAMGIISVKKHSARRNEMRICFPDQWDQLVSQVSPVDGELVSQVSPKLVTGVTPTKERNRSRSSADADIALESDGRDDDDEEYMSYEELLNISWEDV